MQTRRERDHEHGGSALRRAFHNSGLTIDPPGPLLSIKRPPPLVLVYIGDPGRGSTSLHVASRYI